MAETQEKVTAKALYGQLENDRRPFITRAERAAQLTVPALFPKEGTTGSTDLVGPSQSLGARGVRHLASKLQLALFPVNQPFFKYTIDDLALQDLTQATDKRGEVEKALSARERAVLSEINGSMFRPVSFETCRQLVVSGNYLLHIPKEGKPRGHRLNSYVVRRDPSGNVLDIVIKEEIARTALPLDILAKINQAKDAATAEREAKIEVYTKITLDEENEKYLVTQEVDDVELDGDHAGEYPKDALPWLPLRMTFLPGEDYGRGFVEEYIGDLTSLDVLTEALRDGTVQAAKVIWMVAPNSTVNVLKISKTENGGFVQGEDGSVKPLQMNKHADFAVAERLIEQLSERLSFAFLLNTAIQRKGERVTAEEIRFMASELDQGLGGVYSLLSEEFQMPVAKLYGIRMEHIRKVPPLPKEISSTTIVTGLDALGRGNDLNNLDALLAGVAQIFGPDAVKRRISDGEYLKRRAAALGVDAGGLIRSDEEIAAEEQQQMMQAMVQKLGPQAISQMGGMAKQQMANDAQEAQPAPEGV